MHSCHSYHQCPMAVKVVKDNQEFVRFEKLHLSKKGLYSIHYSLFGCNLLNFTVTESREVHVFLSFHPRIVLFPDHSLKPVVSCPLSHLFLGSIICSSWLHVPYGSIPQHCQHLL